MTTDPFDLSQISPDASFRGASTGKGEAPTPLGYYGAPVLKKPHWGWNVVTYLFLGGIMGGSSSLVVLADERDEGGRKLKRNGRYLALALAVACPAVLVSHLGRPERFLNMLRIVKLRSPMSLGVWGLVAYGNAAGLSALAQAARDGVVPRWMAFLAPRGLADPPLALFGSFIAGYTGVLISATAVPLWAMGKRHIPALFVFSGVAGACATHAALLSLDSGTERARRKLERLELVASLAELAVLSSFRKHAGELGAPMFEGPRGERLQNRTILAGIVAPALLNFLPVRSRWKTLLASALTLAGGYILRETVIEAGKASADDPKAAFAQPE
jgi:formate-dependent nitrite reductase membrane component NrfD